MWNPKSYQWAFCTLFCKNTLVSLTLSIGLLTMPDFLASFICSNTYHCHHIPSVLFFEVIGPFYSFLGVQSGQYWDEREVVYFQSQTLFWKATKSGSWDSKAETQTPHSAAEGKLGLSCDRLPGRPERKCWAGLWALQTQEMPVPDTLQLGEHLWGSAISCVRWKS